MKLTIKINRAAPVPAYYDGWRLKHKVEGGYEKTPLRMPEVLPPDNPLSVDMTEAIQRMSFYLMRYFNPTITGEKWTAVHNGHVAFTNGQGFGTDPKGGGPRRNYITNEDMGEELPKYDKAQRVCGGSFINGDAVGDRLVCRAGVHGIDANGPMPEIATIVRNNWYIHAVTIEADGSVIRHFPQGSGEAVAIPFIFKGTITFPLVYFEKWQGNELPNPLTIYR